MTHRLERFAAMRATLAGVLFSALVGFAVLGLQVLTGVRPGGVSVFVLVLVGLAAAYLYNRLCEKLVVTGDGIVRYAAFRRRRIPLASIGSVDVAGSVARRIETLEVVATLHDGSTARLCFPGRVLPDELLTELRTLGVTLGPRARRRLDGTGGPRTYWFTSEGGEMFTRLAILVLAVLFCASVGYWVAAAAEALS